MRRLRSNSGRAYALAGVVVLLSGMLLWGMYHVWISRTATLDAAEPSNIAAIHQAERGALGGPAFVDFYSDDCSICRRIQGPIAELDQRFGSQTRFIYIDTDLPAAQSSMTKYQVRGLPTFVLLDGHGQVVSEISGWPGQQALDNVLQAMSRRE